MDFFSAATDGMDGMSFGWNDLPPAFMGTSSSFGQQPMLNETVQPMLFPDVNGNVALTPNGHLQTTEDDVLAAASLLQSTHSHNNISHHFPPGGVPLFDQSRPRNVSASQQPSRAREQAVTYEQPRPRTSPPSNNGWNGETYYAEMVFGSAVSSVRQLPRSPPKPVDIQWGSDNAFGSGQGFVAPAGSKAEFEQAQQNMLSVLSQLETHSSTANSTQPSSPVVSRHVDSLNGRSKIETNDRDFYDEDNVSRPSKRRKSSKMKEEDASDSDNALPGKTPKKRRPKSFTTTNRPSSSSNGNVTQSPPPSKRRKSLASSAVKPNRENLTEDQKRENHIKSEQKRRTLIKEGFEDLGELVPDLRGGGHSKSAVLIMAADWLEDLIKGNEILRARIRGMENGM